MPHSLPLSFHVLLWCIIAGLRLFFVSPFPMTEVWIRILAFYILALVITKVLLYFVPGMGAAAGSLSDVWSSALTKGIYLALATYILEAFGLGLPTAILSHILSVVFGGVACRKGLCGCVEDSSEGGV